MAVTAADSVAESGALQTGLAPPGRLRQAPCWPPGSWHRWALRWSPERPQRPVVLADGLGDGLASGNAVAVHPADMRVGDNANVVAHME